uniref:Zinc transporter ZIP13 n=1 Tax=Phallusia mammillata TaxID=59560 RepID=A0A6F9DS45_9ASCI|nr:zinc transporter ZIP13 [Phallusia mammillata]
MRNVILSLPTAVTVAIKVYIMSCRMMHGKVNHLFPKYGAVKVFFIILLVTGLAQPIEPILSIHRAGRMSKLLSKSTTAVNDSIGDVFEGDMSISTDDKDLSKGVHNVDQSKTVTTSYTRNEALLFAFTSSTLVGLSGIFPLLIFSTVKNGLASNGKGDAKLLNRLLSFAIGGLLGDVFLHLLPESWEHLAMVKSDGSHDHWPATANGLWILVGLISFCLLEKMFPDTEILPVQNNKVSPKTPTLNSNHNNNNILKKNGFVSKKMKEPEKTTNEAKLEDRIVVTGATIKTSGYLNLLANFIDNFTHGLAVGGSYLVSRHVGILTTVAILLHEIPHEVGDFAILLKAGFSRWHAAKLQILTAAGGLLGTCLAFVAESAKSAGDQVAWILPFTSGGFIYVALCTVVPDILKETSPKESCIQILTIVLAIGIMHAVSYIA